MARGASSGGQQFIAKNRKPRVHIEYQVETNDAQRKIELPFVMGVMSDLSGKSTKPRKDLGEREFIDFDMDNFEDRMAAIAPRAVFQVDNTLDGNGKLAMDLTFKSMADFSPDAVAKNNKALKALLDRRQELTDLMRFMDGKDRAQDRLDQLLGNPTLARALAIDQSEDPEAKSKD